MTTFEEMLIQKGYVKCIFNCKTMRYQLAVNHNLSSMTNLDYRYFPKEDPILSKIENLNVNKITWEDRSNEIVFGLNEVGKPPTLISPRPRLKVIRLKENKVVVENENYDDSMNIALKNIDHEYLLNAMLDRTIIITIDLTKQT